MGEITGVDDDDYIAPTGATEHKKPAPKKKKEETKEVGDGYVDSYYLVKLLLIEILTIINEIKL